MGIYPNRSRLRTGSVGSGLGMRSGLLGYLGGILGFSNLPLLLTLT